MVVQNSKSDYQRLDPSVGLSTPRAFFSLIKSMINTGILYQSRPFYLGGVVYSSIALFFVGFFTLVGMVWLSNAHDKVGGTYSEIAGKAMGKNGRYLLDFIIFLTQFCPAAINIGFMLDLIIRALGIFSIPSSQYVLIVLFLCILIPVCLIKAIKNQFWAHLVADLIVFLSVFAIITYSMANEKTPHMTLMNPEYAIYTLGTMIYGYEGIPLLLPIKGAMQDPSQFNKILIYSMSIIILMYFLFCNVSIYAFGKNLKDIVMLNLPDAPWVGIILIAYSVAVALTMPLVLNPVFTITEKYLKMDGNKIYMNRVCIIVIVCIIGLYSKNVLGVFVSVDGVFASPLSFIFPAIINLKFNAVTFNDKVFSYVVIFVGAAFEVLSVLNSFFL